MRTVIYLLVAAFVATAPWLPATSYASDAGGIMLGGALLLAIAALVWPRLAPGRPVWSLVLLGAFVVWAGLAGQMGIAPFHSEQRWTTWVATLAVAAGCALARGRDLRMGMHAMVASATALTAYGLTGLWTAHRAGEALPKLTATFTNSDCLAALLLMALALAMGLAAHSKLLEAIWLAAESLVLTLGLLLTHCRSAWLGAAAAGLVVSLWCLREGRWKWAARVLVGPLAGLAALLVGAARLHSGNPLAKFWIFFSPHASQDVGLKGDVAVRSVVWHGLGPTFRHYWLWGAGLDNFHLAFQRWHPPGAADVYINQAHCDPIQVLVETGELGFLLLAAAVLAAVWVAWKAASSRGSAALGAAAGLVGVGLYSLSNFAIPVAADLVWIGALIGLCGAFGKPRSSRRKSDESRSTMRVFPAVAMGAMAVLAAYIGYGTLRVAALQARVPALLEQYHQPQALAALSAAIAWEPRNEELYLQRAGILYQMGQSSGKPELVQSAVGDVQTALRLNRRAKDLALRAATFYQDYGDLGTAEQILARDAEDNPRDYRVWDALGRVQATQGHIADAAASFRRERQEAPWPQGPLAETLAGLELQDHAGAALLDQWLSVATRDRQDLLTVGAEAASLCAQFKEAAARFYQVLARADPGNQEYRLKLSELSR